MYYYLGMEAKVRSNKYNSLEKALEDALHVANYDNTPIRIFQMDDCNRSKVLKVAKPDGRIEDKLQDAEDMHNYTCEEFYGLKQMLTEAIDHIQKVPQLFSIYRVKGIEPALAEYLAWENPNSSQILKAIKEVTPELKNIIIQAKEAKAETTKINTGDYVSFTDENDTLCAGRVGGINTFDEKADVLCGGRTHKIAITELSKLTDKEYKDWLGMHWSNKQN